MTSAGSLTTTNPLFYMSGWDANFYFGTQWNYDHPTVEEQIEQIVQQGYAEVIPKWYVNNTGGDIQHFCGDELEGMQFHSALILNKSWHDHNVICNMCHQPAPSKVFFLSEAVK